MRAIRHQRYGPPDTLVLEDVPVPDPGEGQLRVRVHAAAANPLDWHKLRGSPVVVRLSDGLLRPSDPGLGADVAGRVDAVGEGVTRFAVGDAVFGEASGGFADYVCVAEDRVARKPEGVSFEQAAAAPVAGLTALQGLRDHGRLQAGERVLINGASGGVGTFAVQLARHFGAETTGVCSGRNVELVRSLGAEHVVDYTEADFTRLGERWDVVFDAVGNATNAGYRRALEPGGRAVVAGFTTLPRMLVQVMLLGAITSRTTDRTVGTMLARPNAEDLAFLAERLERGEVNSVIDRRYDLAEVPAALAYLEEGHARGKVVIRVAEA